MAYFTKWLALYSVCKDIPSLIQQPLILTCANQMALGWNSSTVVNFLNQFPPKACALGQIVHVSKRVWRGSHYATWTETFLPNVILWHGIELVCHNHCCATWKSNSCRFKLFSQLSGVIIDRKSHKKATKEIHHNVWTVHSNEPSHPYHSHKSPMTPINYLHNTIIYLYHLSILLHNHCLQFLLGH